MAHRLIYWENKNKTFEESKKYSSRTEFRNKSFGAYRVSKKNGWLNDMVWLNRKNVYKDPVDTVYKYYFINENAVYVGRTICPEIRDKQHRTIKNDTVYKFSKKHNTEIPKMDILENGLTILQGSKRESYWAEYYKNNGLTLINKQPCGSVGHMSKGKWSKEKCFNEAKKYKKRSEFQKNSSHAYRISFKNGWVDEMTWLPKKEKYPKGYWKDKKNFLNEIKKYNSKNELKNGNPSAYAAGYRYGYLNEIKWPNEKKMKPFGYWKEKNHVIEEAKKYSSKIEFEKGNQSAYFAALKYGYIEEMDWLVKRKITVKRGTYKNKELIMNEGKKYKTRGEFEKNNKNMYAAALKYGWLDEMHWLPKNKAKPKNYWNNIENVIKEVKKYSYKKEIKKEFPYLYKIIFKKGYINKLNWLK